MLKPCPFCGGEAHFGHSFKDKLWHFVLCADCLVSTNTIMGDSHLPTEEEAAEAWNKRHNETSEE